MIQSKTYKGVYGLNYIQASELAFAIIYIVKREGTQHDKWISGSTNRTHIHESSTGKIFFPTVFSPGDESVFVLFKSTGAEPETPPGVCVPVSIPSVTLPTGSLGVPYSYSISLAGTGPFILSNVTGTPSGVIVTLSGSTVNITGTPSAAGAYTLAFEIGNCSGIGSDLFSEPFNVVDNTQNMSIINEVPGVSLQSISGVSYSNLSQAFPVAFGETLLAAYASFTGVITVNITGVVFPFLITLSKNGIELQAEVIHSDGPFSFDSQSFLSTDLLEILLQ